MTNKKVEELIKGILEKYEKEPNWAFVSDFRHIPNFSRYKMSKSCSIVDQLTEMHVFRDYGNGTYHLQDDEGNWCNKHWKELILSTFTEEEVKYVKFAQMVGCWLGDDLDKMVKRGIHVLDQWNDDTLDFPYLF